MLDGLFRGLLLLDALIDRVFGHVEQPRLQPEHHPNEFAAFNVGEVLRRGLIEFHRDEAPLLQFPGIKQVLQVQFVLYRPTQQVVVTLLTDNHLVPITSGKVQTHPRDLGDFHPQLPLLLKRHDQFVLALGELRLALSTLLRHASIDVGTLGCSCQRRRR